MRRFVLLILLAGTLLHAQETYVLGSDSAPQAGVPKGSVTKYELKAGRFYPGTPHTYSLYVPAQYDANKPTPFMIFLDGSGFLSDKVRGPVVFDNLIARHELPAMIGIFIDPGVLPAVSDQAQHRFERVFEYDSLSDRYSRFLLEELIPEVGKKYNLSKDANDRALCGVSTGAVGAFMAAWNRPDQFHRVLSFIGTYVAMKGADSLPALIRKTEPKPIRVFLQDGTNDHIVPAQPWGTFYAGSWPINNQVMLQAFESAGYDAKLVMGSEGHNMKQGAAILPDALRWLWRDYPNPIVVHEPAAMHEPGWDPRGKVYSTVFIDKPWQQIADTYRSIEDPAADKYGNVFFLDRATDRIYKSDADGNVTLFKDHANGARALRAGSDDRLYAFEATGKRLVSLGTGGDEKVLARNVEAAGLAVTAKGTVYFTNPSAKTIDSIDAGGKTRIVYDQGEIASPAGLALSPDQAMLIVTDLQGRFSWSFQIMADGSLQNGEPFYRLEIPESGWMSGVAGAMEDSNGQVYFATPLGIQVCEANGRVSQILNPPEPGSISSLTFAGTGMNWLYITEGGKLFRRPVKVTGAKPWEPSKPPAPPL
jgi:sugar lactone lactonase YvrE/predicted esterase